MLVGLIGGCVLLLPALPVAAAWAARAAVGSESLRIGYPSADAPYSRRNDAGQAEGASPALVAAWWARAGLPPPTWVALEAGEGLDALRTQRIDAWAGAGPPGETGNLGDLRRIGPYHRSPLAIVSAGRFSFTGPAALAGHRVALAGALEPQLQGWAAQPAPRWMVVADDSAALAQVTAGRADAALLGLHAGAERLREPAHAGLRLTGTVHGLSDGRWLVLRQDQQALADALQPALGPLLEQSLPGLEAAWAQRRGAPPGIDWVRVRRIAGLATPALLVLLACAIWHGRLLRREQAATAAAQAESARWRDFLAHEVRGALLSVGAALALARRLGGAGSAGSPGHAAAAPAAGAGASAADPTAAAVRDAAPQGPPPGEALPPAAISEPLATAAGTALDRLDGLLDHHLLAQHALSLQLRPEPLAEWVAEAVDEARSEAHRRALPLAYTAREFEPGHWLLDAPRLQQVLRRMLGHAVDAHPPGGVAVELALHPSPRGAGWAQLAFEVLARGHALDADARRRLFEAPSLADALAAADPAAQAGDAALAAASRAALPAAFGGGATGLPLAQALLQAMGGTLLAENRPGDGLSLILHLHIQAAPTPPPLPARALSRVLVVHGQPHHGRLLRQALADAGIHAQAAASLADARRLATAPAQPWDLALCDGRLADGGLADWLAWCQAEHLAGRRVPPTIGLVADADSRSLVTLSALGALDILRPESDPHALLRRLRRIWAGYAGPAA